MGEELAMDRGNEWREVVVKGLKIIYIKPKKINLVTVKNVRLLSVFKGFRREGGGTKRAGSALWPPGPVLLGDVRKTKGSDIIDFSKSPMIYQSDETRANRRIYSGRSGKTPLPVSRSTRFGDAIEHRFSLFTQNQIKNLTRRFCPIKRV